MHTKRLLVLAAAGAPILLAVTAGPVRAVDLYQGHYLYLGNDPSELQGPWTEECQGIAHDDGYWYINQVNAIWRTPVTTDLNQLGPSTPGHSYRALSSVTPLVNDGYDHLGDGCVHQEQGNGYLFLPIEIMDGGPPGVAAFQATAGLDYIDHAAFNPSPGNAS
ncbi:MAG: hypothetical protein R3E12_20500, partial [Candidatus Eisenbacteria bacterium]